MAVSSQGMTNREEDANRVRAERGLGDTISAALLISAIVLAVIWAVHYFNQYFGDQDRWGAISDEADDFTALMSLLRDLGEGAALALLLVGLSWVVARTLLRFTRDDDYTTVGTGRPEVMADRSKETVESRR